MKKNEQNNWFLMTFWLFIIGSVGGFIYENLLTFLRGHWVLRQGLIYEPLIPVYGVGLVLMDYMYQKITNHQFKNKTTYYLSLFLVMALVGSVVEYIFSFFQEMIFGTISWNYSQMLFDFNGRTSLFHAAIWGLMFLALSIFVFPLLRKNKHILEKKGMIFLSGVLLFILVFDCFISISATYRQKERRELKEPTNFYEEYLDDKYPDERLEKIFTNAVIVKN